ncbi:hypothetical protein B7463_g9197, partial [Scytalidium lignicola]
MQSYILLIINLISFGPAVLANPLGYTGLTLEHRQLGSCATVPCPAHVRAALEVSVPLGYAVQNTDTVEWGLGFVRPLPAQRQRRRRQKSPLLPQQPLPRRRHVLRQVQALLKRGPLTSGINAAAKIGPVGLCASRHIFAPITVIGIRSASEDRNAVSL